MTGKIGKGFPSDLLIIKRYTATTGKTMNSGQARSWTFSEMGFSNPTGYIPVGIAAVICNHPYPGLCYFNVDSSVGTYGFAMRNGTSTNITSSVKPVVDVIYAPSDLVESGTDTTGKPFKVIPFTKSYSLSNSTSIELSAADLEFYVPEGYQIFSIVRAGSGNANVNCNSFDPFVSDCVLNLRNVSGSSVNATAVFTISFIRKDYAEQILASA